MTTDVSAKPAAPLAERRNPYAGPRSLGEGEPIYGRVREINELRSSIVARRVVLLYSQSGAGKSSLIEAGLRPELERRRFHVFPTIRVGFEPPVEGVNRYRSSVIVSLEEGRDPDDRLDPDELASIGLDEYIGRLTDGVQGDPCLVFDQFEELFTLDPADWEEKEAFLAELGRALEDRDRSALFSMREDFIAQLDPYLSFLPTRLGARYRLGLLGASAAREAAQEPARSAGVDFTDDAADQLVDDLRRIRVQRGTATRDELGPNVEPVQLQVVCRQLWANLGSENSIIGAADVVAGGNVNEALSSFYEEEVRRATKRTGASEKEIREWFEDELISADGFRTQVRKGPGRSGPDVVRELENAHLIRADRRRGTDWYELTHDRFVEPIRTSNAEFRGKRRRRSLRWLVLGGVLAALVVVVLLATVLSSSGSATVEATQLDTDGFSDALNLAGNAVTRFRFDSVAGDQIRVEVLSDQNADLRLLRDESGQLGAEVARASSAPAKDVTGDRTAASEVPAPLVLEHQSSMAGSFFIELTPRGPGTFDFAYSKGVGSPIPVLSAAAIEPQSGELTTASQVDLYTFDSTEGEAISVSLLPDERFDGILRLLDDRESEAGFSDFEGEGGREVIEVILPTTGTYSVEVSGYEGSTGGYELRFGEPEVTELRVGETVSDSIAVAGDSRSFRFDGEAGQVVSITVTPGPSLDSVVVATEPGGVAVNVDSPEEGASEVFVNALPVDGMYLVTVSGFDGSTGDFEVTLDQPEVTDLPPGGAVSDTITAPGEVDVYRFAAVSDEVIALVVTPVGDLDPVLVVADEAGLSLTVDDTGEGEAELFAAALPLDESYLVSVTGFAGSTGEYDLVLSRPEVGALEYDETITGSIDAPGDVEVYEFEGFEGDAVSIVVAPRDDLDGLIMVSDPDGFPLDVADAGTEGEAEVFAAALPIDGTYIVSVAGFVGSTGAYEMTLARLEVVDVAVDKAVSGEIADPGSVDLYRFDAVAGDEFVIAVVPIGDLDPFVEVVDPDEVVLTEDAAQGRQVEVEAEVDGPHTIIVGSFDGSTGEYELVVSRAR